VKLYTTSEVCYLPYTLTDHTTITNRHGTWYFRIVSHVWILPFLSHLPFLVPILTNISSASEIRHKIYTILIPTLNNDPPETRLQIPSSTTFYTLLSPSNIIFHLLRDHLPDLLQRNIHCRRLRWTTRIHHSVSCRLRPLSHPFPPFDPDSVEGPTISHLCIILSSHKRAKSI